jgi:hypothetical protein
MRRATVSLLTAMFTAVVSISCAIPSVGQQAASAVPQTARQALLEMFFSKTPGTFAKHLPSITREAVDKSGAMANLQAYSTLFGQMEAQGQSLQTFETGSLLMATENSKTGEKFEINVANDSLRGDEDDIEVSFLVYKSGKEQHTPYMPQVTFSMKKEAQVWTLNEVSMTVHVPLADPDMLKAMTENLAARKNAQASFAPHSEVPAQTPGSDTAVLAAMRSILTAEVTYAATYSAVGYTCTLSNLDGFGGGEPNEHQAMLINSGLASGKKFGYIFALSECSGSPAASFRLTATPNSYTFGRKTFCADQSAVIRSSQDANASSCTASSTPVQ